MGRKKKLRKAEKSLREVLEDIIGEMKRLESFVESLPMDRRRAFLAAAQGPSEDRVGYISRCGREEGEMLALAGAIVDRVTR